MVWRGAAQTLSRHLFGMQHPSFWAQSRHAALRHAKLDVAGLGATDQMTAVSPKRSLVREQRCDMLDDLLGLSSSAVGVLGTIFVAAIMTCKSVIPVEQWG